MDRISIRQIPLFRCMDDPELAGIRALMVLQSYDPGQVIKPVGEPGAHFSVVTHGRVELLMQDAVGQEVVLDTAGPGSFFGELAMLTGDPGTVQVRAIDHVTTLALDRPTFFAFLERHPHAAIDVLTVLGQRLQHTDTLLHQSVSQNVNALADEQRTPGQRVADAIAGFSGSIAFLVFNATFFAIWLIWNQPWFAAFSFDPFPFGLLTMIVSLEAIFLSIFVLISQNRQATKDRLAADIDHKVNTKAELEIGLVLRRLDTIEQHLCVERRTIEFAKELEQ